MPRAELAEFRRRCEAAGYPVIRPAVERELVRLLAVHRPARMLEIGTCVGYSGCVQLAASTGRLTTVEAREEHYFAAREAFARLGFAARVQAILGDCREVVPLLTQSFDWIFLDGPKGQYGNLYPYLKSLLLPGGVLIADNTDFHGLVQEGAEAPRRERTHQVNLRRFRETWSADADFSVRWLSVGDGLGVGVKRKEP